MYWRTILQSHAQCSAHTFYNYIELSSIVLWWHISFCRRSFLSLDNLYFMHMLIANGRLKRIELKNFFYKILKLIQFMNAEQLNDTINLYLIPIESDSIFRYSIIRYNWFFSSVIRLVGVKVHQLNFVDLFLVPSNAINFWLIWKRARGEVNFRFVFGKIEDNWIF